jgi:hypothetical protein
MTYLCDKIDKMVCCIWQKTSHRLPLFAHEVERGIPEPATPSSIFDVVPWLYFKKLAKAKTRKPGNASHLIPRAPLFCSLGVWFMIPTRQPSDRAPSQPYLRNARQDGWDSF